MSEDAESKSLGVRASELYSKATVTRSLVQLIPTVGSALDTIASGASSKFHSERMDKTIWAIERRLKHLESESQLPLTDELYDLLLKIFESSVKTRSDKKRKYFADILGDKIEGNKSWEEAEEYVRVVSELDEIHIQVLQLANTAKNTGRAIGNTETWVSVVTTKVRTAGMDIPTVLTSDIPNHSKESLILVCSDLVARGLLIDVGALPSSIGSAARNEHLNYFAITNVGRSLLDAISNDGML